MNKNRNTILTMLSSDEITVEEAEGLLSFDDEFHDILDIYDYKIKSHTPESSSTGAYGGLYQGDLTTNHIYFYHKDTNKLVLTMSLEMLNQIMKTFLTKDFQQFLKDNDEKLREEHYYGW